METICLAEDQLGVWVDTWEIVIDLFSSQGVNARQPGFTGFRVHGVDVVEAITTILASCFSFYTERVLERVSFQVHDVQLSGTPLESTINC